MTHSVAIHALMVSWYARRRPSNPAGDVMMNLEAPTLLKTLKTLDMVLKPLVDVGETLDGLEKH